MKKAVLLSISEENEEIESLLDTLNVSIVREYVQKRSHPHRVGFLGPGKLTEVKEDLDKLEFDLVVINGVLKPSQHHFLEMKFQKECIDRPGVILRIFTEHAHTPDAIAQVTLAKLRYEVPFLREWIHKAKSGDRPGFLAGGAYATDVYLEHARTQARRIEKRLADLSKQRETGRTERRSKGYTLVSLAGYTNAGKSALLNKLCDSQVEVDDRMFSTLSTTTRRVTGIRGNVLMTDTVGFIKDLPPDFIRAFHSTLEEVYYADVILLVFDASETEESMRMKLSTSLNILTPKIEKRHLLVVANKMDLVSSDGVDRVKSAIAPVIGTHDVVYVSAKTGYGMDGLRDKLEGLQNYSATVEARLPLVDRSYGLLSRIRSMAVVDSSVASDHLEAMIRCKPEDVERIAGWLEALGGFDIFTRIEPSERPEGKEEAPVETKGSPSQGWEL